MSEASVIVSRAQAGVARVTLDRPAVHNAFDDRLIADLTARLQALDADPDVRVVVLEGRGKSFSAGADLNWMKRMAGYSREENYRDSQALASLMHTLDRLGPPTVAAVHGAAIGGGVGLVACCDIAIAADSALFALSEVRLGLTPAVISPYVVRAIGERQARRYFVTAERFGAARARELGLVHEVVTAEALAETVDELLLRLLRNGPEAMRDAKALARDVSATAIDETLRDETARRISERRASAEGREGVTAFLEKRHPDWTGG